MVNLHIIIWRIFNELTPSSEDELSTVQSNTSDTTERILSSMFLFTLVMVACILSVSRFYYEFDESKVFGI